MAPLFQNLQHGNTQVADYGVQRNCLTHLEKDQGMRRRIKLMLLISMEQDATHGTNSYPRVES
ncbi:hypothetical protein PAAG_07360 [Paracoccidioides lutzii Pb01]|uniref:Uncharacterized protein n=1 Tax=Paracoccidioides lutzii (strain ATCC MYA-826 / Pb01) TaxID=502779 RepID=C1H9B9_PARBA|nr:hypothetical protein PAAG_07360 [Paracoccidioides lutzii Pb01]EEH36942.2 hypothetical protein PAAG_07360 [Paracoccidioides lutzii Pb01]